MRIVGGRHRGRALVAPRGAPVRPTSDRAREAVFDILEHGDGAGVDGARVLDAFCGTGALALEALSRGAARAVLMDTDTAAARTNIEALGENDNVDLIRGDCLKPRKAREASDLVFLDPPYNSALAAPALTALAGAGWIADGAVCVVEMAAGDAFTPPDGFTVTDDRRYGKARVTFLVHETG